jgi:hypothetical protein
MQNFSTVPKTRTMALPISGARPLRGIHPIIVGGVAAGTCDILAALAFNWARVPPVRVLQYIASGLLGPAAFDGGAGTAVLGLGLHFLIASGAAAGYYAASRLWPLLLRRPVTCGLAYGVAVYLVMNLIVLPLSQATVRRGSSMSIAIMIGIHMLCVGLPIALAVRASAARSDAHG